MLFEGIAGTGYGDNKTDTFDVDTVVDDNSLIYDLGEKSCLDIQSSTPRSAKDDPWYGSAIRTPTPADLEPKKSAKVQLNHCYLTFNNDSEGRVIALFACVGLRAGKVCHSERDSDS